MRWLAALFLCTACLFAPHEASAQLSGLRVVQACGTPAPWSALNASTTATASAAWLTVNPSMQTCAMTGGGGGGGCTAATNYLARTTGGNEGGNAANITTLICGLVSDGVITGDLSGARGCGTKLDALYIIAQQNAADALLNLCGTSYSLTNSGVTFTSFVGYSNLAAGLVSTGFDPTAAPSPNYTQNSAHVAVWVYSVAGTAGTGIDFGGVASNAIIVANYNAGNTMVTRINDISAVGTVTPGTKGLFAGERTSSTQENSYWDGVSQGAQTISSVALGSETFLIGRGGGGFGPTPDTISEVEFGAQIGSTLQLALYNRLRTYMTAVGVP